MERFLSVNYTPSKNALVPKKCRNCHQFMEIKQINLTEAVRQCYKCSSSFQQLVLTDIEFFHRSYQDVNKSPEEWSPFVSTEEAELIKFGSWIKQLNLTLDKYEESNDDSTPVISDFSEKFRDGANAVTCYQRKSNNRNLGNYQSSLQGQCGMHIEAMEELDAALAEASVANLGSDYLPFSLDYLFQREQELPDSRSSNEVQFAVKNSVPALSHHEFDTQGNLSDTTGVFQQELETIRPQDSRNASSASISSLANIAGRYNIVEDRRSDEQTTFLSNTEPNIAKSTLAVVSSCLKSPLHSSESTNQTCTSEKNQEIQTNVEEELLSEVPNLSEEHHSITVDAGQNVCINAIILQNHTQQRASSSNKISDDSRKTADEGACISSTVASERIMNPPSILLSDDPMQNEVHHQDPVYVHTCGCDDASLQLSPIPTTTDNQCLDFKLPPLFHKRKETMDEENLVYPSDVEKVVFSKIELVPKRKLSPRFITSSGQSHSNSKDVSNAMIDSNSSILAVSDAQTNTYASETAAKDQDNESSGCYYESKSCPRIVFTTQAAGSLSHSNHSQDIIVTVPVDLDSHHINSCSNILVTVPADVDITEGMLGSVTLNDLPILTESVDGNVTPTCPNSFHIPQSVKEESEIEDIMSTPHEEQSSNGLSSPLPAFEGLHSNPGRHQGSFAPDTMVPQISHGVQNIKNDENPSPSSRISAGQLTVPNFDDIGRSPDYDKITNECQSKRASSVDGSESSLFDNKTSTCSIVVDQPLRLVKSAAEEDDDDLSSFTGAKFKPTAFRKTPQKKGPEPQLLNFFNAVAGGVRTSRDEQLKS